MKLSKFFEQLAHRHSLWTVWQDFLLMCATSLSNAVDIRPSTRGPREAAYLHAAGKYTADELNGMAGALGQLILDLEARPADILGQLYMALELGNKWAGQFFTPDCICQMMARMLVDEHMHAKIAERGFITVQEPAIGGGAMIIGLCGAMLEANLNPQTQLHVTGIDVDIKSIHMSYIQLAILGVPAVLVHGNALTLETHGIWYTPAHILGGWQFKLRRDRAATAAAETMPAPLPSPVMAARAVEPVQADLFALLEHAA